MKAVAVFFLSAAMLIGFGASAFAVEQSVRLIRPVQQWVGKPATQVVKALGEPSYTSTTNHGRLVYDFVQEPQHVGPIGTYQFVIGPNGKVAAATLTFGILTSSSNNWWSRITASLGLG